MSPVEAIERTIAADRVYADPALWITRVSDDALRTRARHLEGEGARGRPLFGMPVAVKDNIDVAGLPTTAACPDFSYSPSRDALAVARLIKAGAIVIGKTNLDQFATGLVGVRSPHGTPRNAFDPARVPGGSSSGSAVAVAAGIVPVALGTDTAGSGRVPAMFGNVVGLKPTVGSVSASGMVPACRSIDTVSVFSESVDAGLAMLRVIAGYDAADAYSRRPPFAHLRRGALPPKLRIGVPDVDASCEPDVAAAYRRAAATLPGAVAVDIAPLLAAARLVYDGPWVAERTAALRAIVEQRPDSLFPVTRAILSGGFSRTAVDAWEAFHEVAEARRFCAELFTRIDALLVPTAPFTPTLAELAADPIGPNSRLGTFTNFVNICDLAAVAVPAGFGADGLPAGVTVIGPAWSDGRLACIADAIHRASCDRIGATTRPLRPPAAPDKVAADETALFCIGAHMAGLPLNGQVTELGGRFIAEARTAPAYNLFALGDRPGMVRVDDGGTSVTGEIWALPTAAIGALLASVPSPLGFGNVTLDGGDCLGFLAEASGVARAHDISHFGGWRAYRDSLR